MRKTAKLFSKHRDTEKVRDRIEPQIHPGNLITLSVWVYDEAGILMCFLVGSKILVIGNDLVEVMPNQRSDCRVIIVDACREAKYALP